MQKYERKRISPDWVPFVFYLRIFVVDNLRVINVPTPIPYIENAEGSVFIYEIRMLNHNITHTTSWDSIENGVNGLCMRNLILRQWKPLQFYIYNISLDNNGKFKKKNKFDCNFENGRYKGLYQAI